MSRRRLYTESDPDVDIDLTLDDDLIPKRGAEATTRDPKPRGYHHYPPDEPEIADLLVDGVHDPHANDVTAATLQREQHVERKSGGGSRRKGRERALKPQLTRRIDDREAQPRRKMQFRGLTKGEIAVLSSKPGMARSVLAQEAAKIEVAAAVMKIKSCLIPEMIAKMPERSSAEGKKNFDVYGLTVRQCFALRFVPGYGQRALIVAAHEIDHDRVLAIDAE